MKKITAFDFKGFLLFLFLGISVFAFTDNKDQRGKFIDGIEVIRVTDAAGVAGIAETQADILVVVDRATTVAAATCPFPAAPRNRQLMGISSRVQITALTLDDGPNDIPISGYTAPFTLAANTVFWRIYDEASNRWFPY